MPVSKDRPEKERRLPAPDLFASCPYDGSVVEYYRGQFEAIFVVLHPFMKAISIDPDRFYPETYPSKSEILEHCSAVRWEDVIKLLGLENIDKLDIGLRTAILGLKKEVANEQYAEAIERLEIETNIVRPTEGDVPPLIQNRFFDALEELGHDWLWLGDEFGTERKLEWIEDLKGDFPLPSHGNLFTPDKGVLLTTHWDSHFSFLCSSRKVLDQILEITRFEGFFCDETTEVYWSVRNEQKQRDY